VHRTDTQGKFPTVWSALLKGHIPVEGIPRERKERNRSLLHIPLITGEQLVFDADVKNFAFNKYGASRNEPQLAL
jgi:hypothetical protein